MRAQPAPLFLRLPATSANLGPGFDAVALALALHLEITAVAAASFSIQAEGRHREICAAADGNLLLDSYRALWAAHCPGSAQPLALQVRNEIPMGMGCGSSAAARLASVALVSHFGSLGWTRSRMLAEASALEHHPDNVAACALGGLTVAGYRTEPSPEASLVLTSTIAPPRAWHALLVLPATELATTLSRAVLPTQYERAVIVRNLQNVALLVAAFAREDGALLASATRDGLHEPYREAMCPLLGRLRPLAGMGGILSVTLSGAGSGVLLLLRDEAALRAAMEQVRSRAFGDAQAAPLAIAELLPCSLEAEPARLTA